MVLIIQKSTDDDVSSAFDMLLLKIRIFNFREQYSTHKCEQLPIGNVSLQQHSTWVSVLEVCNIK